MTSQRLRTHAPATPAVAFLSALALIAIGLVVVPATVRALGQPFSLACSNAFSDYDPGYGIGELAASPSCTLVSRN
jgi:xanthosine utilization system XapX-like protein